MVRHRRHAFTLIELLVVIAIIAILAAILFPVFAQAKAAAKQSACLSNLKQQALAIIQYQNDYDDVYPIGEPWFNGYWNLGYTGWQWPCSPNEQQGDCLEWGNAVYPYIKNQGIFSCPVAQKSNPYGYPSTTPDDTYTFNGTLQCSQEGVVQLPSTVVLMWSGTLNNSMLGRTWANPLLDCEDDTTGCSYVSNTNGNYNGNGSIDWIRLEPGEPNISKWLHGHGDNFDYADGHAKWHPLTGSYMTDPWTYTGPNGETGPNTTDWGSYWEYNGHTCLFSPDNPCGLQG
jgi:prepilin-type N-terminal cleavage/methylation domain-containing protein